MKKKVQSMNQTRKNIRILKLWVFCLIVLMGGFLYSQAGRDIELRGSISSDRIGLDDILIYTLTFKGINNPVQPQLSHFKDFRIAQTSRSSEFKFINGISSYYTNFIYYLVPQKTGKLKLPPVSYKYKGSEYKTQAFTVEVVKGSIAPKTQSRRRRSFFDEDDFFSSPFSRQRQEVDIKIIPEVSTKKAVLGQQIIFRVLLYTRNQIRSVNMLSSQSLPGFWQEWFPTPNTIDSETKVINGKSYQVYEVRKAALFPTKTGKIEIPSLQFEVGLMDMNSISLFSTTRPIQRFTPEITIDVSSLPQNATGLPVGNFNFSVTSNKKEVDINDILTLKIRIRGNGNFKTLNVPEIKNSEFYKIYPAKISREFIHQEKNLRGYVEAEVPVAFKKVGLISFPSLEFQFYNPNTKKVVSLTNSPIIVKVTGKKEKEERAITLPKTEIIKTGEDIDFIKNGAIYNQDNNFFKNRYFKYLLLIPFLINILLIIKIFLLDRLIFKSSLLKKKKLMGRTINGLKTAKNYGEISPILENYLKEKTGLGLSEINNHNIDQLLEEYGIQQKDIGDFMQIKTQSESYRFSPQKISSTLDQQLKQDLKILIEILKRIDSKLK